MRYALGLEFRERLSDRRFEIVETTWKYGWQPTAIYYFKGRCERDPIVMCHTPFQKKHRGKRRNRRERGWRSKKRIRRGMKQTRGLPLESIERTRYSKDPDGVNAAFMLVAPWDQTESPSSLSILIVSAGILIIRS